MKLYGEREIPAVMAVIKKWIPPLFPLYGKNFLIIPSGRGMMVMLVLSRPEPRLTRCGPLSVARTLTEFPCSRQRTSIAGEGECRVRSCTAADVVGGLQLIRSCWWAMKFGGVGHGLGWLSQARFTAAVDAIIAVAIVITAYIDKLKEINIQNVIHLTLLLLLLLGGNPSH